MFSRKKKSRKNLHHRYEFLCCRFLYTFICFEQEHTFAVFRIIGYQISSRDSRSWFQYLKRYKSTTITQCDMVVFQQVCVYLFVSNNCSLKTKPDKNKQTTLKTFS